MDTLSKLVPLADATLEITSLIVPQANWARTGKNIVSLLSDLSRSGNSSRSGRSYERYDELGKIENKLDEMELYIRLQGTMIHSVFFSSIS